MKFGKVWGEVEEIFCKNNVQVMHITGKKGHKSSLHCHKHKKSIFYVMKGTIRIDVKKKDYDLIDTTILKAGESTEIGFGEYHSFEVLNDAKAIEIYWVELDNNDIVRDNCGS